MTSRVFVPLALSALGLAVLPALSAVGQSPTPDESLQALRPADGLQVELVAAEPLVRQPVAIEFDDRGRLWVIQYLQYPNPAGLKRVRVDRYSRTEYDRVPEPPPRGPRGADRITILEDLDGDGRMDRGRDFVEGLNLATGLAFGHGGVFVLNVPYLLFYPDRDRNDLPDSDPEVLLSGFGMQDAHSVANSLTWGPDGWLYGCQGSTVTANIGGIEFQQGVWRYHPFTRKFELFCEGGGNCWGLDFDARGQLLYSTNYGGHVLVHGLPGAYFVKSFAKHGALHNPFTYGYFEHAAHADFRGGHVTVGGVVFQGNSWPVEYRGKYIAGDLLGHGVYRHDILPQGSTFATAHGGELLTSQNRWFAPTDVTVGPDGAVYVADWCDGRTAHPDPDADWDRSNGRIYRIAPRNAPALAKLDFALVPEDELLHRVTGRIPTDQWGLRRARQELVRRLHGDALSEGVLTAIRQSTRNSDDESAALESLWTAASLNGFDEALAFALLDGPHAAVRAWTVRLLGDLGRLSDALAHRLDELAEREPAIEVRVELACLTQRIPADQALPIINANIIRDIDADDPRLPLLWWWGVEKHCITGREDVLRRFVRATAWNSRLGRETLLPRLARRYAAEGTVAGWDSLTRLLQAAPDSRRDSLWEPIRTGLRERLNPSVMEHAEFRRLVTDAWAAAPGDPVRLSLAMLLPHPPAIESARREAFASTTADDRRVMLLGILEAAAEPSLLPEALDLLRRHPSESVRRAALSLAARHDRPELAEALISLHLSTESAALRSSIRDVLLSRKATATAWLHIVDRGRIPAAETPVEQIRRIAVFEDGEMNALVAKHWGRFQAATPEEKLAEVRRLNNDLRAAPGDAAAGEALFKKHCAACHRLFGQGTPLGPDLTSANRQDRDFLLVSLVDPGAVIRKEYVAVTVHTRDGRVLTGLPVARDAGEIKLVNGKDEPFVVTTAEIEEMVDSTVSLMPADLYRQLSPQQLRDLFAYLQRRE